MNVSKYFVMILNLAHAAEDHKTHCNHNCNVSLFTLKETAKELSQLAPDSELFQLAGIIADMPNG